MAWGANGSGTHGQKGGQRVVKRSRCFQVGQVRSRYFGQARTGMGKTFAFGVPLLDRITKPGEPELNGVPRALIVVPTTLLTQPTDTTLVRSLINPSRSAASRSSWPSAVTVNVNDWLFPGPICAEFCDIPSMILNL